MISVENILHEDPIRSVHKVYPKKMDLGTKLKISI